MTEPVTEPVTKPVTKSVTAAVTEPLIAPVIERWHQQLRGELAGALDDLLDDLLDDDVVFYSPVVYTPQHGKAVTSLYLSAALGTLAGERPNADGSSERTFRYTKQVLAGDTAVLEFETTMDGKYVNGVDIIRCNAEGRIVEFRVMIRPLQAINAVHEQMKAMLERMTAS